ncbi:hypothetical protein XF24_00631 [candidate division SR1 bacterium Aalborg_AAW-1]|nr:hypothetical protein XF24_00631 [candidate division SR1 bacterium Aalborg_AAW-1]
MKIYKAFTLIEMLIVIVIIGILSSALIPRVKGIQDKARYTQVQKDFQDLKAVIFMAQTNTGLPLKDITGTISSELPCRTVSGRLSDLPNTHACKTTWISSLRKIEQAAGIYNESLKSLNTDPRGSPYLLNENQGEYSAPCVRVDNIRTAGPNRISNLEDEYTNYEFSGNLISVKVGDDVGYAIPPLGCTGEY